MKNVNSDVAYAYVRKRILSGELRPGQALMPNELAEEIGISRTPVRDALRQLEADGLVVIRAHLGASVKAMSFNEYREMCGLRLALESYAAGLAAENRTTDELREMKLALEAMREFTKKILSRTTRDEGLIEALRKEDVRFHIAIISAAKSKLLMKEVLRLHIISRVVSGPSPDARKFPPDKATDDAHKQEVQVRHDEIYQAIEGGDAPSAKAAMEQHIQDIIDTNLHLLASSRESSMPRQFSEAEQSYTL